jgi:hypothetical protein
VTQSAQSLVWFTSGHGEHSTNNTDPDGLSELKRYLEQQNLKLEEVTLLERPAIPADVKLVILAGPTRRFTEPELVQLQEYLQGGGRLLAPP